MPHRRDDAFPSHPGRPFRHAVGSRVPEHTASLSYGTIAKPGLLQETARIEDSGVQRVLARGFVAGTARNGDVITFVQPFAAPPLVALRGGISYEPRSKWNTTGDGTGVSAPLSTAQYDNLTPLNLTATGFTLRARLRQKGTATGHSDYFGGTITARGQSVVVTVEAAPSANDSYTTTFTLDITASGAPGESVDVSTTLSIDTSTDGGATWTSRWSQTYSASDPDGNAAASFSESIPLTVSGLTSTSQVRIYMTALSGNGSGGYSATVTPGAVTYTTSGTDQYASKTPDTDDFIEWSALAVA